MKKVIITKTRVIILSLIALITISLFTFFRVSFYVDYLTTMARISQGEYITAYSYVTMGVYNEYEGLYLYNETVENLLKIYTDPIEIYSYDSKLTNDATVIYKENDTYYQYTLYEDGETTQPKVYETPQDLGLDTDSNKFSLDLGFKLKNLKKQDGKYIVSGRLNQVFKRGSEIDELIRSVQGITYSDTKVVVEIEFSNTIKITTRVYNNKGDYRISLEYYLVYKKGNPQAYEWENYQSYYKDYLDYKTHVIQVNLNEQIETEDKNQKLFNIYLEPGIYVLESNGEVKSPKLFENRNVVCLEEEIIGINKSKNIFQVNQSGYYTFNLEMKRLYSFKLSFKISKLDYIDCFTTNNTLIIGNNLGNSGVVEGEHDYVKYSITMSMSGVAIIKNTTSTPFMILVHSEKGDYTQVVNDTAYVPLSNGQNAFYVCNLDGVKTPTNYSFDVEIKEIRYDITYYFMPEITNQYSDFYYISSDLPKLYFKLEFTEDTEINFYALNELGEENKKVELYVTPYSAWASCQKNKNGNYEFKAGKYIVEVITYSNQCEYLQFKYEKA